MKSSFTSRRARTLVVAVAAGALALTGCSENKGGNSGADSKKDQKEAATQSKAVTYADAAASTGPAADVAGAKSGGTIQVYQESGLTHLDPGQIYVSDAGQVANLLFRRLTQFKEDDKGNVSVVSRRSEFSQYRTDLSSFTMGDSYDQKDAAGFIRILGLPSRSRAQSRIEVTK